MERPPCLDRGLDDDPIPAPSLHPEQWFEINDPDEPGVYQWSLLRGKVRKNSLAFSMPGRSQSRVVLCSPKLLQGIREMVERLGKQIPEVPYGSRNILESASMGQHMDWPTEVAFGRAKGDKMGDTFLIWVDAESERWYPLSDVRDICSRSRTDLMMRALFPRPLWSTSSDLIEPLLLAEKQRQRSSTQQPQQQQPQQQQQPPQPQQPQQPTRPRLRRSNESRPLQTRSQPRPNPQNNTRRVSTQQPTRPRYPTESFYGDGGESPPRATSWQSPPQPWLQNPSSGRPWGAWNPKPVQYVLQPPPDPRMQPPPDPWMHPPGPYDMGAMPTAGTWGREGSYPYFDPRLEVNPVFMDPVDLQGRPQRGDTRREDWYAGAGGGSGIRGRPPVHGGPSNPERGHDRKREEQQPYASGSRGQPGIRVLPPSNEVSYEPEGMPPRGSERRGGPYVPHGPREIEGMPPVGSRRGTSGHYGY